MLQCCAKLSMLCSTNKRLIIEKYRFLPYQNVFDIDIVQVSQIK